MAALLRRTTLIVLAAMLVSMPAHAGSIWARASHRARAVYADDSARYVGDLLTVIINEHSVIENEISRGMQKTTDRKADMTGTFSLGDVIKKLSSRVFNLPKVDVSGSSDTKFDGKADYDSDRSVTDKITVVVEDVLPNGNLVILGKRERVIAGDREIVQISGIVRPSDVGFTNEINSNKIADFTVVYKNVGQENHFTRPGWFARILNLLNPS